MGDVEGSDEVAKLKEQIEALTRKNELASSAVLDLSQRVLSATDEIKEKDEKIEELEKRCTKLSGGFVAIKEVFFALLLPSLQTPF